MKLLFISLVALLAFSGCDSKKETSGKPGQDSLAKQSPANTHETIPFNENVPNAAIQIKLALLAAPPEKRDSATVYGYDANKNLVIIKKGSNELICLASNPDDTGFSVSCYNKNLEPLMESGRELRKRGIKGKELFDERAKEVKEGSLKMPDGPSTLYVYSADSKDVNKSTGEVKKGYLRYVIYIPFATAESTGLPTKPSSPGMPWIMDAGTYRAHVMINP
jgi:hypothetical protein